VTYTSARRFNWPLESPNLSVVTPTISSMER
jgi:hypothetical protein